MWNQPLELHATRSLEQNNSVSLQPSLKERPEIFDVGCCDHAFPLFLLLERRSELADSSDDVSSGSQRETGDIGVTLC